MHYKTLDSTNNLALQFARVDAREGAVIAADFQTQGRGRFKRRWISARGKGLLFSIILRPHLKASEAPILTHLAAQSVAEALKSSFNLEAKLKRPNDVLVKGKKIAGILTESSGSGSRLDYVVMGIGLNLNHRPKELLHSATSIYVETGKQADHKQVLAEILARFSEKYNRVSKSYKPTEKALKSLQHA